MCNSFKLDFGKQLKKQRSIKKITQESLALESGISRSHIAMVESGKRDISLSALFKISRALDIDLGEMFKFDNLSKYKFDIEELYE